MRLTTRGRYAVLFCVALWVAAFVAGSAAAAAVASAASLFLAVSAAMLDRPRIEVTRTLSLLHAVEGDSVEETFTIKNLGRAREALLVESATQGMEPAAGQAHEIRVRLPRHAESKHALSWRATTWGRKTFGPLRVVARDPLGLLEVDSAGAGAETLRVQPAPASLRRFRARASNPEPSLGAHIVSKPGDSSEFFALREYQPGDSVRRINWKATARSTSVVVNQATRDTYARILIIVDVREKEDVGAHAESPIVRNVRAAASLIAHHDRDRDHLTVLMLGDKAALLSTDRNPRKGDLFDNLVDVEAGGHTDVHAAIKENLRLLRPRSPVYFVTSAALDPSLLDAVMLALGLKAFPILLSPSLPEFDDPDSAFRRTRDATIESIRAMGVPVYDWKPGDLLGVTMSAPA